MAWLVDQPDNVLSSSEAHYDGLFGAYSFVNKVLLRDPFHERVIHRSLARHLTALIPQPQVDIQSCADEIFGLDDKEFKTINIIDAMFSFIPRATNRIIVGGSICRVDEYIDNMVQISHDVIRNMLLLTFVPPVLRPVLGRLASLPVKYHYGKTARYTIPSSSSGWPTSSCEEQGDPRYADWVPPNDYISWHITLARAEGKVAELDPVRISERLVPINFATIHTTAITSLNLVLDFLSSDGEYGTMAAIAEEVRRVYGEEGGQWTKAGLARLYRLDSAIRESMRVSAISQTILQKKVVARAGVTNPATGWHFEYGTLIECPMWGTHHDPDLFGEKAHLYDPFRYSREREAFDLKTDEEKDADERLRLQRTGLVTTSDTYFPFGHGRHAW